MEQRIVTCIGCPLGCQITVGLSNGQVIAVEGNSCKRGAAYARKEVTSPTRIVTSTVRVSGGRDATVPVKTRTDIPKDKIFDCIRALQGICVQAPVEIGDVILEDAAGTGVDIIAAGNSYLSYCFLSKHTL